MVISILYSLVSLVLLLASFFIHYYEVTGDFLVVQELGLHTSTPWELRSHKMCSAAKIIVIKF